MDTFDFVDRFFATVVGEEVAFDKHQVCVLVGRDAEAFAGIEVGFGRYASQYHSARVVFCELLVYRLPRRKELSTSRSFCVAEEHKPVSRGGALAGLSQMLERLVRSTPAQVSKRWSSKSYNI